jgi:hypothetical protein
VVRAAALHLAGRDPTVVSLLGVTIAALVPAALVRIHCGREP